MTFFVNMGFRRSPGVGALQLPLGTITDRLARSMSRQLAGVLFIVLGIIGSAAAKHDRVFLIVYFVFGVAYLIFGGTRVRRDEAIDRLSAGDAPRGGVA